MATVVEGGIDIGVHGYKNVVFRFRTFSSGYSCKDPRVLGRVCRVALCKRAKGGK